MGRTPPELARLVTVAMISRAGTVPGVGGVQIGGGFAKAGDAMGTDMKAFVEYDTSLTDFARYGEAAFASGVGGPPAPFDGRVDTASVSEEGGLYTGSKDYAFFAAVAGVRNDTGVEPLFAPRGVPRNPSLQVRLHVERWGGIGDFGDGWLTLAEIKAALAHHRIDRNNLGFETQTILFLMEHLEGRVGVGRVRLVFGFWG